MPNLRFVRPVVAMGLVLSQGFVSVSATPLPERAGQPSVANLNSSKLQTALFAEARPFHVYDDNHGSVGVPSADTLAPALTGFPSGNGGSVAKRGDEVSPATIGRVKEPGALALMGLGLLALLLLRRVGRKR